MDTPSDLSCQELLKIIQQLPPSQISQLQRNLEQILENQNPTQSIIRDWIFSDEILQDDYQLLEYEKRFNL